jgi:hypothetical protein
VTPPRAGGAEKNIAIFAAKLVVTGGCFWYVFKQVDPIQTLSGIARLDVRWAAFATFIVMLQIPLVALRWRNVLRALAQCNERMTRAAMIAITAIGLFFAQVLPSVASEGVRAWLLVRLGSTWRYSVTSLVIDRGVGVGLLIMLGFGVLLLPSGLIALGGYREAVLIVYGTLLAAGLIGLLLALRLVPYLARWRYSRWTASLIGDAERVLLGPRCPVIVWLGCLHHALTIVVVWSVARAQGRPDVPGRGGSVHGHGRRAAAGTDLGQRLGSARARHGLAARQSRRQAGNRPVVLGLLRRGLRGRLTARGAGMARLFPRPCASRGERRE